MAILDVLAHVVTMQRVSRDAWFCAAPGGMPGADGKKWGRKDPCSGTSDPRLRPAIGRRVNDELYPTPVEDSMEITVLR